MRSADIPHLVGDAAKLRRGDRLGARRSPLDQTLQDLADAEAD